MNGSSQQLRGACVGMNFLLGTGYGLHNNIHIGTIHKPTQPECMEICDLDGEKWKKENTPMFGPNVKDKCVRVRCGNYGDFFMGIWRDYTSESGFRELWSEYELDAGHLGSMNSIHTKHCGKVEVHEMSNVIVPYRLVKEHLYISHSSEHLLLFVWWFRFDEQIKWNFVMFAVYSWHALGSMGAQCESTI